MPRRHAPFSAPPGRVLGLLQAVLFLVTMAAAPLLHQVTCDGVCSAPKFEILGSPSAGRDCCHAPAPARSEAPRGCGCLDDCCSITASFTAAPAVADLAPPAPLEFAEPPAPPAETPRAASARLLPYPTGPPPAA
ncbi:MAG: hypothetical protein ACM3JJ_05475 [Hyphomicrobiales bacterium]